MKIVEKEHLQVAESRMLSILVKLKDPELLCINVRYVGYVRIELMLNFARFFIDESQLFAEFSFISV